MTPLAIWEFLIFPPCLTVCIINDCISKKIWTACPPGFSSRMAWLIPPFAVSQFMLMIRLDELHPWVSWSAVMIPALVGCVLWLCGETMCQSCCSDDAEEGDSQASSLEESEGASMIDA